MAALDAIKLAERLQGLKTEDYWLHLDAAGPLEKYPAKQHARRVRDKLNVTSGLIYLPGEQARNNADSDMPAPFRQLRYFYYLSGCNEPNCHLTYDVQHDTLSLFIPRINPARVIWNGRGSTPSEALDKYDIDAVYFIDELHVWLQAWSMRNRGDVYILHKSQATEILSPSKRLDSTSLQPAMNLVRMIKDDHEIQLIRKANDISSDAHKQVLANITKFKNEAQVEGLFLDVCTSRHAKQQAYDIIAASGPNAGTLHYDANNEDFEDRQLMCLDAGCEYELYASDITRTFPLSGHWPSSEAENIYNLVQRMQEVCIERMAPGVRYLDLHILAHQIAIDGLLQLGILHNGTREEIYKAGTSRAFFPHGLGHHIGLEVHDVGQKELMSAYERNPKYEKAPSLYPENFHSPVYDNELCRAPTDPQSPHLEEGMVITVEPGIYFSAYALGYFYLPSPIHSKYINKKALFRYMPVGGVRIEDDILVTAKGYENLTTAPKGEVMLEIIRSQNAKWPFVSETATPRWDHSGDKLKDATEEPLRRAPGIPQRVSEPRIKSLSRAATAPVERPRNRDSVDFEPCDGPSLYTGFKRSTTTDENAEYWRTTRLEQKVPPTNKKQQTSLCGDSSLDVQHIYMTSELVQGSIALSANHQRQPKGMCKKCGVLSQTLGRLREQLKQSDKTSTIPVQSPLPPNPAATRRTPEMQQIRPPSYVQHRNSEASAIPRGGPNSDVKPTMPKSVPYGTYWSLERDTRNKSSANIANVSHDLALRTSKTSGQSLPSSPDSPIVSIEETIPLLQEYRALSRPNSFQPKAPPPQLAARRDLPTASEREREVAFQLSAKGPTTRASLPALRSGYSQPSNDAKPTWNRHTGMAQNHPRVQFQPLPAPRPPHSPPSLASTVTPPLDVPQLQPFRTHFTNDMPLEVQMLEEQCKAAARLNQVQIEAQMEAQRSLYPSCQGRGWERME